MKRLPQGAVFVGLTCDGLSVYATNSGIVAKRQPKPPRFLIVVTLLLDLHRFSPMEYETYRTKQRALAEIFLDPRLLGYPTWTWLYGQRRYRFKPVERYFLTADHLIRKAKKEFDGDS
jgi:hypothetical protein